MGRWAALRPLKTFTVSSANNASLSAITTRDGGISVTASGITLTGTLATDALAIAGPVSLTGPVTLGGNISLDSDATTTDANLSFSSTIDAGATANSRTLTLAAGTGTVSFGGAIGSSQPLQAFTITSGSSTSLPAITTRTGGIDVTAGTITITGNLTTTATATADPLSLTGDILAGGGLTLSTDGSSCDANITLTGTVNAPGSLTLAAGSGSITVTGQVGNVTPVTAFTVSSATSASVQSITTGSGGISLTGTNISLRGHLATTGSATAGSVTLAGTVTLSGDMTISTDGRAAMTRSAPRGRSMRRRPGAGLDAERRGFPVTLDGIETTTALKSLTVQSSGLTTLSTTIRTDDTVGAGTVDFSGAPGGIRWKATS